MLPFARKETDMSEHLSNLIESDAFFDVVQDSGGKHRNYCGRDLYLPLPGHLCRQPSSIRTTQRRNESRPSSSLVIGSFAQPWNPSTLNPQPQPFVHLPEVPGTLRPTSVTRRQLFPSGIALTLLSAQHPSAINQTSKMPAVGEGAKTVEG